MAVDFGDPLQIGQLSLGNPLVAPPSYAIGLPLISSLIEDADVTLSTVAPTTNQVSSTPAAPLPGDFSVDAFRNGGVTQQAGTDPLIFDRVLSDDQWDEDAASISIVAQTGANPTQYVSSYGRFFLTNVSEPEQEKFQIVETFTAFYVYFYGKKPSFYRYSGYLLNDPNFRWTNDFRFMYDNYFSGTASADLDSTAILTYDKKTVTGMVVGFSLQEEAGNPKGCPFSLDLLVLDYDVTGGFSSDIAGLLLQAQQNLAATKAQIAANMAQLNANIPSQQALTASQVLGGNLAASTPSLPTSSATAGLIPANQQFTAAQSSAQSFGTK